jgi:hypothetical protein
VEQPFVHDVVVDLVVTRVKPRELFKSVMRQVLTVFVLIACCADVSAHGIGSTPTWNREVSRLIFQRCASCHRPGGSAFSLLTYPDAQPRANEIKDAVLMRRMPPWGAVKGFGRFRNDVSLSQEQIETITRWVDGGIRRGNNPRQLPDPPTFSAEAPPVAAPTLRVSGPFTVRAPLVVDGVVPERVPPGQSLRVVAISPDGAMTPLIWLHDFNDQFPHPFLFTSPLTLPTGTTIQGVPPSASIGLITTAARF